MKYLSCLGILLSCLLPLHAEDGVRQYLSQEKPVWYDQANDNWKRTELSEPKVPSDFNWLSDFFIAFMYLVIIGLIAYLLYLFISHMRNKPNPEHRIQTNPDHVQHIDLSVLPFSPQQHGNDPYLELLRAHQEEHWLHVIIYSLMVLLTEFHHAQYLHLRLGKTNRHYLRELKHSAPSHAPLLQLSIQLFEQSYFGHQHIDPHTATELFQRVNKTRSTLGKNPTQTTPANASRIEEHNNE